MSNLEPIAYTYEADHHCPACAESRFGRDSRGYIDGTDNEGNPIGALAPWDEWHVCSEYLQDFEPPAILACGTCGRIIDEHDCLVVA